jgi:AcrR family transcriptional regulator
MIAPDATHPEGPRDRAARTKRDRTRAKLLHEAQTSFGMHGWAGSRMELVAHGARLSTATAYNHLPTKHVLIGHVSRPLVRALRAQAQRDLDAGRPVREALTDQVHALVLMTSRHRILSGAYLAACQEYAVRTHAPAAPDDELDPRAIAPMPEAIRLLVAHGQQVGELRRFPVAADISGMVTTLLLVRGVEAPHEHPEVTAELLLTVLFGALRPEWLVDDPAPVPCGPGGTRWTTGSGPPGARHPRRDTGGDAGVSGPGR